MFLELVERSLVHPPWRGPWFTNQGILKPLPPDPNRDAVSQRSLGPRRSRATEGDQATYSTNPERAALNGTVAATGVCGCSHWRTIPCV